MKLLYDSEPKSEKKNFTYKIFEQMIIKIRIINTFNIRTANIVRGEDQFLSDII